MDSVLPLSEYTPLFTTKAEAKRYRKQVLEHVAHEAELQAEFETERNRILASFGTREPAKLGDDFIAKWAYVSTGGTTIRKQRRRELRKATK